MSAASASLSISRAVSTQSSRIVVRYNQHPQYATSSFKEFQQCCITDTEAARDALLQHRRER
jgi:hypothetical protein